MNLPQTGGCQCGKIRYEITEAPQSVYACHCRDCQRLTSSAFSMGVVVPETAFKLSGVEPRPLQRLADSGRTSTRWVCPDCGSWIAGPARDGRDPGPSGDARRYLLAPADPAHLDAQQAAVGSLRRGRRDVRDGTARIVCDGATGAGPAKGCPDIEPKYPKHLGDFGIDAHRRERSSPPSGITVRTRRKQPGAERFPERHGFICLR